MDSSDELYIADFINNRVRRVDGSGTINTIASGLNFPIGLATDGADNLYIADNFNHRVLRRDSAGTISTVAGTGTQGLGDGGPATEAQLSSPYGLAADTANGFYIADNGHCRVRKVDPSGTISTVAGTGDCGFSGDGGPATSAELNTVAGLALDNSGNLYIADPNNNRVRKLDGSGTIDTVAGTGTAGFAGDGGLATSAKLDSPRGVAVDGAGNLYIADTFNHRVRKVDGSGTITTVAGSGSFGEGNGGFSGDGGQATSATLNAPAALAVDGSSLYISDFNNNRVRRVELPHSSASQDAPAGGTVSTNSITNPVDPVGTSVTTPVAGTVTIAEADTTTANPSGYSLLGQQVEITAPDATAADPLVLEFRLDDSLLPSGADETTVELFRNGILIADCDAGAGASASPDPCVATRTATAGGVEFTVRTSQASSWNFGVDPPPNTMISSGPQGATNDPTPSFSFSSSEVGSSFQCKLDSNPYAACSSPKTLLHLTDGSHTFSVRAKDSAAQLDPTPSTRNFTVRTAEVKVSGSTLLVTAATGAKDNLVITKPTASTLRVTDLSSGAYTGSGVRTGAGCTRGGDYTANCNSAGITLIQVSSGDQIDKVTNSTALKSSINGGAANDLLTGGSAADTLTGSTGVDVLKGMNGSDQLMARDLTSDTTIACGGGTADKADLDVLPKDPASAVIGCETKTRH